MKHWKPSGLRGACACLAFAVSSWGAEPSYSGTYVMLQEAVSVTELPILKDIVATVRTIAIVELDHSKSQLKGEGKVCQLTMDSSSSLVKTSFPPAFQKALPQVKINARVTAEESGVHFEQRSETIVLGARLKDPLGDALPSEAKDPRVFDQDRDGQPGVTVAVSGFVSGKVYLVQRSSSRLSGRRTGDGFSGRLIFENEQKVIGASARLLKRDPGAVPDLERSRFHLKRVKGPVSCQKAIQVANSL
jgi:hypothetical protein